MSILAYIIPGHRFEKRPEVEYEGEAVRRAKEVEQAFQQQLRMIEANREPLLYLNLEAPAPFIPMKAGVWEPLKAELREPRTDAKKDE